MSAKRKRRRLETAAAGKKSRHSAWLVPFLAGSAISGILVFGGTHAHGPATQTDASVDQHSIIAAAQRPALAELTSMTDEELRRQDLALVNLRCAEGLPGSNDLNLAACLQKLDQWAARVRSETERHLYRAHDPQFAKEYRNSEAYLRVSMMLQVLQEDFGVHYNMQRVREVDFTKSQDLFIHGLVASDNGGTCVSMPVLYTAVARRLGYPLYLVTAKAHLFCRWDDGKERLNIEGSGSGFSSYDDEYYTKWPRPISPAEVKAGYYLKSLSAREELAVFLSARGHCLEDNGRVPEARVCYAQALQRRPDSPDDMAFLVNTLGFTSMPYFQQVAHRPPLAPVAVYPTPHDLYTDMRSTQNPDIRSIPVIAPAQQHDAFKTYTPFPRFSK